MEAENLRNLLQAVAVEGLAGRTWEGKDALLDATAQLCCRNAVSENAGKRERSNILILFLRKIGADTFDIS